MISVRSISQRYVSSSLLLFGSVCGLLAFVLVTAVGVINYRTKHCKVTGTAYESGMGYWPATFGELAHDRESVGGKLFYTFGMVGGMCIFMSFYPYNLRNVYTGNAKIHGTQIYWITFRQLCPSMGMWLLIGINTYPTPVALASKGKNKLFCVFLHQLGAGIFFLGYTVSELKCLGMLLFQAREGGSEGVRPQIEAREMAVRRACAWTIIFGFTVFIGMQSLIMLANMGALHLCCPDKWTDETKNFGRPRVLNTASHAVFVFKVASFVFEAIAGCALVLSQLAIWYFCEERHMNQGMFGLREAFHQPDDEPELPEITSRREGEWHVS